MMFNNMRGIDLMKVIKIAVYEGEGTEEDRGRIVYYYYDVSNGDFLFSSDPKEEQEK